MPRATKLKEAPIVYSVHPGVAMVVKWVAELITKTGRSLEEWVSFIQKNGPPDLKDRREWLKTKYQIGTNTAWWLAERAGGQPTWDESPEAYLAIAPVYVDEMFAGAKARLRPLCDALFQLGRAIDEDVKICPCKTIVPFYRNHVIAEIKPSTRTRIDFGLALGDEPFTARLKDTGGLKKKNRITHKVEVAKLADLDDELTAWLTAAYDRDG